jgi:hypothetical protein
MSELTNTRSTHGSVRHSLFATASITALLGYMAASSGARAVPGDEQRPTVWIELGGQMEHTSGETGIFLPPFSSKQTSADLAVVAGAQQLPPSAAGFDGKISFEPGDSNWVLSASVRYGRSGVTKHLHHQSPTLPAYRAYLVNKYRTVEPARAQFADAISDSRESHAIVDFQAGKDVGLGLFGNHGSSIISAGIRFAQFASNTDATIRARPTYTVGPAMTGTAFGLPYRGLHPDRSFQSNTAVVHSKRSTRAVGPSLSWNASAPIVGDATDVSLNFDWGMNAAILFGRQRTQTQHQTSGYYFRNTEGGVIGLENAKKGNYTHGPYNPIRSRTVMIPNLGGTAAISLRFYNSKVTFGYRSDFFFNAMDVGVDKRISQTVGFYGPFATVSIGLGG